MTRAMFRRGWKNFGDMIPGKDGKKWKVGSVSGAGDYL